MGQPEHGGTVEGEMNRKDIQEIYHLLRTELNPTILELKKTLEKQIQNSLVSTVQYMHPPLLVSK